MITTISGGAFTGAVQGWARGGFQATWWDAPAYPSVIYRQINATEFSEVTVNDRIYNRSSNGTLGSDFYWPVTRPQYSANSDAISHTSTNTGVLLPDNANPDFYRYVANGTATISHASSVRTLTQAVTAHTKTSTPVDTYNRYVTGSLRKHMTDSIDALLVGKNAQNDKRLWTVQDHTNLNYIRNPSCWVFNVNLTCLTPYNTSTGANLGATLFTPLHVMQCRHAPLGVGAVINFVALDGTVHQRTLDENITVKPQYGTLITDMVIGRLNSPLPAAITPAKLPPSNWASYIPDFLFAGGVYPPNECRFPGFVLDRTEEIMCKDYAKVSNDPALAGAEDFKIVYLKSLNSTRALFDKTLTSGDSGNPCFWLINNNPVLVAVHTGPGAGTYLGNFLSEIDTITSAYGYTATRIDLTGFPVY